MNFAKEQLSKHGWTEGQGLGRTENGITEAIKVKIKQNKTGVGHDPGEEFSFHWWDHVFNKAASKIKVKTTDNGVEIKNEGDTKVSKKKDSKTYCNKSMLYGQFVKGATLSDGTETQEEQQAAPSEDEETTETVQCLMPDQADTVFKMCGGRTAHKGARHGLKLNGKLQRIEEQERLLLEKYNAAKNTSDVKKGENADCSVDITNAEETYVKKKSKKDKKKRDLENKEKDSQLQNVDSGIGFNTLGDSNTEVELNNDNVVDIAEKSSKKDKKRKRKRNDYEENENVENGLDSKTEVIVESVADDDGETKVKSKKRKKNKKNKEGDNETSVGDENCVNVTSNNTAETVVGEKLHCDGDVVDSDKKRKKNKKKKRDNSSID